MKASQALKVLVPIIMTGVVSLSCVSVAPAWADDGILMLSIAAQPKGNLKTVQARMAIEAPPELVWQVITAYPELKNILPGYEKSTIVQNNGRNKLLDIGMKVAAFLPTYRYRVQVHESAPDYRIILNRVSGDFQTLNATYKLSPQNGGKRTILAYTLDIDTGLNMPGSQAIIRAHTERSLRALERYIEQEAHHSEIGQR